MTALSFAKKNIDTEMDTFIIGKYLEAQKHYYYPGVREQFRFPPAKRVITEELPLMIEIEQERIQKKLDFWEYLYYTETTSFTNSMSCTWFP